MKMKSWAMFIGGMIVGAVAISPALALLVPSWDKPSVMPVVICSYDSPSGFKPSGNNDLISATWSKEQVTPVVLVSYQSLAEKFVPLNTDSINLPAWPLEAVKPWAEVVQDSFGNFVPKNAQ